MIRGLRTNGKMVGVLAVDPTSPFSGGAILGIAFACSGTVPTRGYLFVRWRPGVNSEGLTHLTRSIIDVLDAMGSIVIVKTFA